MDQMICYNCFRELGSSTNFCIHCGFPVAQDWEKYPHALPYGTALGGRYITGRVLGQGGFGITYIAQDYKTKQLVAIKEFFPDTMAARGAGNSIIPYTGQRGEDFNYGKTTFLEEARTLAQFNDTPGIVNVYSYFEEFGTAYFAMEYIDGMSLQKYIEKSGGRISWDEAKRILVPVMDALAKVHAKGIIHRDIKPDNIHISRTGEIKVLDFGSARYSMGEKSRSLDVVLTHGFAPREQYSRHGRQGAYTDVYALAATFFYAVTGKKPPDSIDRLDEDTLPLPSSLGAQIPKGEEDVILKALSVEPQDRYATMVDFKAALLNPQAAPQPAAPAYTAPQPTAAPAFAAAQSAQAPAYTAPQPTAAPQAYTASRQQAPQYTGQPQTPAYTAPQPAAQPYAPSQAYTAPRQQTPQYTGQPQAYAAPQQGAYPQQNYAQPVQQPAAQQSYVQPAQQPAAQQKKKNKWIIPTVIGIAAAAIVLVVALAVSGVFNKKPETDPTAQTGTTTGTTETQPENTMTGKDDTGIVDTPETDDGKEAPTKPILDIRPSTGGSGSPTVEGAAGYYAVKSMTMGGVTLDTEAMLNAEIDVENTYLFLSANHTGSFAFDGETTDLTWTDDGSITIEDEVGSFFVENGLLSFEIEIDDGLLNMVFERKGDTKPAPVMADPSEGADGKCGDNVYWRFDEDTLYLNGTGSTDDYTSTNDIPWFEIGVDIDYVVVGEGITRIGDGCFYKCQMVSVDLPETLKSIGYLSFGFCPYISYVSIPESVSYLGDGAFYGSSLEYAYVYSRSLSMDIDVFAKCEDLTEVYFYGSIVGLGLGSFEEDVTTVYYPGDDPSWNAVVGNDYGGTLTWLRLGESADADYYSAKKFSIGLPTAWQGKYYVRTDDTGEMLIVYHKASADAGYGGMLYCFRLFEDYSEYMDIPSWEYVGYIINENTGKEFVLIAILPTDVQFPSEYQEQYTYMLDSLFKISFAGETGYYFTAQ